MIEQEPTSLVTAVEGVGEEAEVEVEEGRES